MITRREAIRNFLQLNTHVDLASLYTPEMEVQVNVDRCNGEPIEGVYLGKGWNGWQNSETGEVWKQFRIPFNANTDPHYEDQPMSFDIAKYAAGIGLTGWNFEQKKSLYVAFDFDAITGHSDKHSKKLSDTELLEIIDNVKDVSWVTLRRSTSGNGLHIYVFFQEPVSTNNHSEHQALARYILGKLCAITGFDFNTKVDARGSIMWIWHRKMVGTNGLTLLKEGTRLDRVDDSWREHIPVVQGKRKRILPGFVQSELEDLFEESASQQSFVALGDQHKKLIKWLIENNFYCEWNTDHHILITHTSHLKEAFHALNLKGIYDTLAAGESGKGDKNCYAHPLRNGSWIVRRYNQGVAEKENWFQDTKGWTTTYYNRLPDFDTACKANDGLENAQGNYVFVDSDAAKAAAKALSVAIDIPEKLGSRQCVLKKSKTGKLIVDVAKDSDDGKMPGWIPEKKFWTKVFSANIMSIQEIETPNFDDVIRHLVTEDGKDADWRIKSDNVWVEESLQHVKAVLAVNGVSPRDIQATLGASILKKWTIVNKPFQPEYLENRQWNLNSAQFRVAPTDGEHFPTWQKILNHCGRNLDDAVKENEWCKNNTITTGADYLKLWIVSLFQEPNKHLPYLFFYGDPGAGKSTFYESLQLLITPSGVKEANTALMSQGNFNGEMSKAVLCYVEEVDLRKTANGTSGVYNKIKNWVTNEYLTIHPKGVDPYQVVNTTHWIQAGNQIAYCPVLPGDLRIVVIRVDKLSSDEEIPRERLFTSLKKEASDFLGHILKIDLPETNERLNIPVLKTVEKIEAEEMNMSAVEKFINEKFHFFPGEVYKLAEFFTEFKEYIRNEDNDQYPYWTKEKVKHAIPIKHQTGTSTTLNNYVCLINISRIPPTKEQLELKPLTVQHNKIIKNE